MIEAGKGHPFDMGKRLLKRIKRRLEERGTFAATQQEYTRLERCVIGQRVGSFAHHHNIVMHRRDKRFDEGAAAYQRLQA